MLRNALTTRLEYDIIAPLYMRNNMYEVYSIDTKITNIDKSHNLERRTEAPVSIHSAVSVATKLERLGHIIELRKVSQQP